MAMQASSSKAILLQKHDNDVVIVAAVRSAMTKVERPPVLQSLLLLLQLFSFIKIVRERKADSKTLVPKKSSLPFSVPPT